MSSSKSHLFFSLDRKLSVVFLVCANGKGKQTFCKCHRHWTRVCVFVGRYGLGHGRQCSFCVFSGPRESLREKYCQLWTGSVCLAATMTRVNKYFYEWQDTTCVRITNESWGAWNGFSFLFFKSSSFFIGHHDYSVCNSRATAVRSLSFNVWFCIRCPNEHKNARAQQTHTHAVSPPPSGGASRFKHKLIQFWFLLRIVSCGSRRRSPALVFAYIWCSVFNFPVTDAPREYSLQLAMVYGGVRCDADMQSAAFYLILVSLESLFTDADLCV